MNGRLKAGEKLSRGIRRAAREQIHRVVERLAEPVPGRRDEAIHQARQGLKKIRATLRLARPVLGGGAWRREDRVFRDAGRALAHWRDAEVLIAALAKLRLSHAGGAEQETFAWLEELLRERKRLASAGLRELTGQCESDLRTARRRVKGWPLRGLDWDAAGRAIQRAYRRGFKAFAEAARTGDAGRLHEWRKRVKDLWHQLRLVRPVLKPGNAPGFTRGLQRLGACLGDDHDLAMLEQAAQTAKLDRHQLKSVANLIHARRVELQREAFELGRRLYDEKPAMFRRHLKARK